MHTSGIFDYTVAWLMTAVTLWRAPALYYGDAPRRALWGCYAGFALSLWLKTPIVLQVLNQQPIVDLPVLLGHYADTAALVSIITYVAMSYGTSKKANAARHVIVSRRIARIVPSIALAVVLAITVLFFTVVERPVPTTDFVAAHIGQWGAAAYLTVFYLLLGTASFLTGYQWAGASRRAETRALRIGLVLMTIAAAIGLAYAAIRTEYIWSAVFFPASWAYGTDVTHATAAMQVVLFICMATGAAIPTANSAIARWATWRTLWLLYPLWRDLVTAFPQVAFHNAVSGWSADRRPSRFRGLISWSLPLKVRLSIRVHNIADAVEQLRHYAPPGMVHAAEDMAEEELDAVGDDEAVETAAAALYVRAALHAVALNQRYAAASEPLPHKAILDPQGEALWWLQVRRAYSATSAERAACLLSIASAAGQSSNGSASSSQGVGGAPAG
ncbi:hypothetical protein GCM10010341_87990 [Streptomyces noursei]|nr:hypothetical protein GCM10010341_87990 [Streptomyces noursei]